MEVDALMKGKGKNKDKDKNKEKGKDKDKEKNKGKSKDKSKEGTTDTSNMKCFFYKEKGHSRKDYPKFSTWLVEKKTVGGNDFDIRWSFCTKCDDAALRPRSRVGTVIEDCA